ncbi:Abi-like protein [Hallella colorans]|uniref:Abi-like protein n=1 Tax=Hallella colorans TaxID=1703337 RepID=A0A2U0UIL4_9BACT|nr:Abi-like protein [Hallella colorans]
MDITDEEKAQHYLSHIGYYRLSAYMFPLLSIPKERQLFKPGVTFSKVMMLYRFDKKILLSSYTHIKQSILHSCHYANQNVTSVDYIANRPIEGIL